MKLEKQAGLVQTETERSNALIFYLYQSSLRNHVTKNEANCPEVNLWWFDVFVSLYRSWDISSLGSFLGSSFCSVFFHYSYSLFVVWVWSSVFQVSHTVYATEIVLVSLFLHKWNERQVNFKNINKSTELLLTTLS